MNALENALLEAHARHDGRALIGLYAQAGDEAEARGDGRGANFYRTHALVFALEAGDARAEDLRALLTQAGADAPLRAGS